MHKIFFLFVIFISFVYSESVISKNTLTDSYISTSNEDLLVKYPTPYEYINELRVSSGLNSLTYNEKLEKSAFNHSIYIVQNEKIDHYEIENDPYFTGLNPTTRAYFVNFNSNVSENLSVGQNDYVESIDDLFGAIYHRFGFLDFDIDLIGIANQGSGEYNTFVYNMGNSQVESLCKGESYIGYKEFIYICKDSTKRIEYSKYNDAKNISNPEYVIWPYKNYNNVPPVFFEEIPDPLPTQRVSGYPISIQFNPNYYKAGVELNYFELYNNNKKIDNTQLINNINDVNENFSEYQFALFPIERLRWGSTYNVKASYLDNSTNTMNNIEWSFKTKALEHDFYTITNINENIKLIPNKTYNIYMKPLDTNEYSNSYSMSYQNGLNFNIDFIDMNTLEMTFEGEIDQTATIIFSNGRSIDIVLSDTDNATLKETQDSYLVADESTHNINSLNKGWHLLGAVETINDMSIFNEVSVVWTYKNGSWYVYSNNADINKNIQNSTFKDFLIDSIKKGNGFWVLKN